MPPRILRAIAIAIVLQAALLTACTPTIAVTTTTLTVTLTVDGNTRPITTDALLVRDLLNQQGIILNPLDEVSPSEFTALTDGMAVRVVRVTDAFEVEQAEIPYERQTVRNETLPEGDRRLLQTGVPGLEEVTYRVVYRDGVLASRTEVRRTVLTPAQPEIIMVGVQNSFITIPIEGTLAYISAGNAWIMRENSGSRRPITLTGDLDGRVFDLSADGEYLLYTRNTVPADIPVGATPERFNTLWAVSTLSADAEPINLGLENVLWAGWSPAQPRTLAYTTGEPTNVAPGWVANNELNLLSFDINGNLNDPEELLPPDEGGAFGSYGTQFVWSPDGNLLGYSRGDNLGIVNVAEKRGIVLARFTYYNTRADWTWLPDVAFSVDSRILYTVIHGEPVALEAPEDSPVFDLAAIATDGSFAAALVRRAGIWAAPTPDPTNQRIAYLQSIDPLDTVTGRYRLAVMDRDGSNSQTLFPAAGEPGLGPQQLAWSPDGKRLALIWQGNLWVIDSTTGVGQQLTGDAQTTAPDWGP